jgi:hypothetical protein
LREISGYIYPIELGANAGNGFDLVKGYRETVTSIILSNPNSTLSFALSKTLPVVVWLPAVASGYDYTYDQITNTGQYASLIPRGVEKPTGMQAAFIGVGIVIAIEVEVVGFPK